MAALCAARLADIYCKQGQLAAARHAVAAADLQLSSLEAAFGSAGPAQLYCCMAFSVAQAQLLSSSGSKDGGKACQAAVASCRELAEGAAPAGSRQRAWCCALLAAALLQAAEAAARQGEHAAALQHAADALAAAAEASTSCSSGRHLQAAALLFLGQHAAPAADADQHLAVWGLGPAGASSTAAAAEAPATKGRTRKAPAKQPASRGRGKAAAAAAGEAASDSAAALQQQHVQHLWRAFELSRAELSTHR